MNMDTCPMFHHITCDETNHCSHNIMRGQSGRALLSLCWESEREKVHSRRGEKCEQKHREKSMEGWKVRVNCLVSISAPPDLGFILSQFPHTLFQFQHAVLAEKSNPRVAITDRHPLSLSVSVGLWVVVGEASVSAGKEERLYFF